MKVNGEVIIEKATEFRLGKTVQNTQVIGRKTKPVDKVSSSTLMGTYTMGSGKMIKQMVMESTII